MVSLNVEPEPLGVPVTGIGVTMAGSEIEELVNGLGRRKAAALAELRSKYGEAVGEAISRANGSGCWESVKAIDGAVICAYPESEGRIAWSVDSVGDGLEISHVIRRADGGDDELVLNPRLERLPPKEVLAYLVDAPL